MNKKIILAFTGLMASGKDTSANYLKEKYGASIYSFSTMLFDTLGRFYLEFTRDNLVKISEIIRSAFGENIMARTLAKDIVEDQNNLIVVSNVRRMADIEYLSKMPNFVLIEIFADPRVRYERLVSRGEKADDKTKTFEQFMADHERSTELSILETSKRATERIDNNSSVENLHSQLDVIIEKFSKDCEPPSF